MSNLTELPTTAQPSLLLLNEDCLLELFDFLKFEDSMNLAETCVYLCAVANRTFRNYSTMQLDGRMAENRKECIDRFFTHFGHLVRSLIICSTWGSLDWSIVKNCENLKRLQIWEISRDFENDPPLFTIDNLEVLSLERCDPKFVRSLLNIVRKVALSICGYQTECNVLMNVFRNSPDMESFELEWYSGCRFDFHLLEIISNVERLSLDAALKNVSELDPLLKLHRLSKLKLGCDYKNITSFLSELARKGIIQELELELTYVVFDENYFEMLKSFDSLQLLVLCDGASYRELKSSIVWPPNLKRFRLRGFKFTLDAFLSMIKQLKYLESICIYECRISDHFNDVKKFSQQILAAIDNCDRKQQLDVAVPWQPSWPLSFEEGSSKKFLHDSERLRIYQNLSIYESPLEIRISFRGM